MQNFVSAAVGIWWWRRMIRGFVRTRTDRVGNFWVDLTRCVIRLLIPLSIVGGLVLIAGGAIENFDATRRSPRCPAAPDDHRWPGGSSEVIKEMGTNGGGIFNANSAHPFENPNGFTNWLEIFMLLMIAFATPRLRQDGRTSRAT